MSSHVTHQCVEVKYGLICHFKSHSVFKLQNQNYMRLEAKLFEIIRLYVDFGNVKKVTLNSRMQAGVSTSARSVCIHILENEFLKERSQKLELSKVPLMRREQYSNYILCFCFRPYLAARRGKYRSTVTPRVERMTALVIVTSTTPRNKVM